MIIINREVLELFWNKSLMLEPKYINISMKREK